MPTKINTTRKILTTVFPGSFSLINAPNFPPNQAPGISATAYSQLTFPIIIWATELVDEVKNSKNMEVATAICGGKWNNKINEGTINDPPPIPRKPPKKPTIIEMRNPVIGLNPYVCSFPNESL